MERLPLWLGAGAVAAGVSAAALAGAGTANADTDPGGAGTSSASSDTSDAAGAADSTRATTEESGSPEDTEDDGADLGDRTDTDDIDTEATNPEATDPGDIDTEAIDPADADPSDTGAGGEPEDVGTDTGDEAGDTGADAAREVSETPDLDDAAAAETRTDDARDAAELMTAAVPQVDPAAERAFRGAAHTADATVPDAPSAPATPAPQAPPSLFGLLAQLPPPVRSLGSVAFDLLGIVIRTVTGPPQVPPGSTVTVRSSTLRIDGRAVTADWYFPDGDAAPQRMIYLQHGFLANSRMYSYTAAMLAERTNSVVVAPTLNSNPFTADDFWLGGDPMYRAVADLFVGDRAALHASAVKAGYPDLYGDAAVLPEQFVMAGHSLGGGLVIGVAGHYAQAVRGRNEENQLAGVVALDGVPPRSDIVTTTLTALREPGGYVPIYALHAPTNYLNSTSTIVDDLAAGRAGQFHGVELNRGVHMDSMLGANPLIQLAAYVVAGFPAPQNPPAAHTLTAGWINDMFAGRIDPSTGACAGADCAGIYGSPGAIVDIPTGKGRATATVLGVPGPTARGIGAAAVPAWLWRPDRDVVLLDVA